MMNKKNYFSLYLALILAISSYSQKRIFKSISDTYKEKIYLHTNSKLYLTGEHIYYKIYCLDTKNNSLSSFSKIAYLKVIDKNNEAILTQKVKIKNGLGSADLFLPSTIKTDNYKLVAYTQWMRNSQTFYEANIFIINPFSKKISKQKNERKIRFTIPKQSNLLSISIPKEAYKQREKVKILFNTILDVNLSISVKKVDSLETTSNTITFIENFENSKILSKKEYLPEIRGTLFKGKITSKKSVENKKIALSFIGENKISKISVTNKKGYFFFNLNKAFSAKDVIIEVLEENKSEYTISLDSSNVLEKKFLNFKPMILTENLRKIIKDRSLNLQVENAYKTVKKSEIISAKINDFVFHKNKNKTLYNLDDYKRFNTVKEIAVEVLENVWLSKENNEEYSFHIRDVNLTANTFLKTLLIVDGYIVDNHKDFVFFDALKIKTIEVVREKYNFGSAIYQGILNIETFKNDFKPNVDKKNRFTLLKPEIKKNYYSPNYSKNKKNRVPDYRTQLYWNPEVNILSKGVSFFTSDVLGKYQIIIEGFTKKGKPIYETLFFTVE